MPSSASAASAVYVGPMRRPYVRRAGLAAALGVTGPTVRARVRAGTLPAPVKGDAGTPRWDLRVAAEAVRKAGKPVPAAWIRALLERG